MLEQIKAMKYKKQYAYIAGGGVILAILYILISVYITNLAYKTIINLLVAANNFVSIFIPKKIACNIKNKQENIPK